MEATMRHGKFWTALTAVVGAVAAALAFALPASAHHPSRGITLTAGTSSSARSTSFDHGSFKITIVAYFGRVTRTTAFLDHITFKTCPDSGRSVGGGLMFAYNHAVTYRYNADSSRVYYSCGSFTQQVDKTFTGGYANGNVAITMDKRQNCVIDGCSTHESTVVFYVP
jgi:hypothetical protein